MVYSFIAMAVISVLTILFLGIAKMETVGVKNKRAFNILMFVAFILLTFFTLMAGYWKDYVLK